jgi:hypothetical protein
MSTISRIALVVDGTIVNVVLADLETWTPPAGAVAMPEAEALGLGYERPVPTVDPSVVISEALRAIFFELAAEKRARLYPLRAGMRLALESADLEAAAAMVAGFDPADEEEEAIRAAMLAALGVS